MSFRGRVRGGLDQPLARHEERVPGNRVRQQRRRAMRLRVRRISASESGLDPTFSCLTPAGYRPLRSETSSLVLAIRTPPGRSKSGEADPPAATVAVGSVGPERSGGAGGMGGGAGGGAPRFRLPRRAWPSPPPRSLTEPTAPRAGPRPW